MKNILALSFFVLFFTSVYAQKNRIDSLLTKIDKTTDPKKIDSILNEFNAAQQANIALLKKGRQDLAKAEATGSLRDRQRALLIISKASGHLFYTPEELDASLQGIRISRDKKDYYYLDRFLHRAGLATVLQQDARKADNYFLAAANVALAARDTADLIEEYSDLESDYVTRDMPDSAIFYARLEMQMVRNLDTKHYYDELQVALSDYGEALNSMNKPDSALFYYRRAYQIAKTETRIINRPFLENNIAKTFLRIGKPDSAVKYAREAYNESSKTNMWGFTTDAAGILANIYEGNDNKKSLFYLKAEMTAKDSANASERSRQFQQIAEKDRQRQADLKTAQEKFEARVRLYMVIGAATILLAIGIILWRNNRKQKHTNKLLSEQKEEIASQRDHLGLTLDQLKSTQTQLIQSEKMASLGELTAGIAHEIQNPLNFVNNFSEVNKEMLLELEAEIKNGNMEDALALTTDLIQNEEKISHHGKRADGIVKGMLEHSRSRSGEKEPTDLNAMADEFMRLSYHGLRSKDKTFNAEMVSHFDPNLPKVNVSQQDIGRVLLNLFNNAFYAVNQKKKTADPDYKPEVSVSTSTENGQIIIKVKDNGVGIPDGIKEKIMQPFFTTKPTGEGTGLGLSLTYDIVVKGHGGVIKVNSVENSFTEITVTIPLT